MLDQELKPSSSDFSSGILSTVPVRQIFMTFIISIHQLHRYSLNNFSGNGFFVT